MGGEAGLEYLVRTPECSSEVCGDAPVIRAWFSSPLPRPLPPLSPSLSPGVSLSLQKCIFSM